jgi:hypothetical protein
MLCGLGAVMIIMSLVGIFFGWGFGKSMKSAKCSVATVSNDFLSGTKYDETEWIGLAPAITTMDELKKNITDSSDTIGTTFSNTDWIEKDEKNLKDKIAALYTDHKDKKLSSPTPGSITGVSAKTVANLGPSDSTGTITNQLS